MVSFYLRLDTIKCSNATPVHEIKWSKQILYDIFVVVVLRLFLWMRQMQSIDWHMSCWFIVRTQFNSIITIHLTENGTI